MNRLISVAGLLVVGVLALAGCSTEAAGRTGCPTETGGGTQHPIRCATISAAGPSASDAVGAAAVTPVANTQPGASTAPRTNTQPGASTVPGTITATATGTASGTPDQLTVTIGVQTTASNAAAALADNNTRAAALIATLKKSGVAGQDLQTTGLSINPQYDRNSTITGYTVSNMVTAKLRNTATAGTLLDAAAKAAGNGVRINGMQFTFSNPDVIMAKARAEAVKKAMADAKQMADAAGIPLGSISSITENTANPVMPQQFALPAAAASGAAVPIETGSQEVSVTVQVVYNIAG